MNKTGQNAIVGLLAVVLVGLIVVGFLSLSRVDQFLKNQAFADCARLATYTEETTATWDGGKEVKTSTQPIRDLYKTCIEDKGYQTAIIP